MTRRRDPLARLELALRLLLLGKISRNAFRLRLRRAVAAFARESS